jgi:hypothetical protein
MMEPMQNQASAARTEKRSSAIAPAFFLYNADQQVRMCAGTHNPCKKLLLDAAGFFTTIGDTTCAQRVVVTPLAANETAISNTGMVGSRRSWGLIRGLTL